MITNVDNVSHLKSPLGTEKQQLRHSRLRRPPGFMSTESFLWFFFAKITTSITSLHDFFTYHNMNVDTHFEYKTKLKNTLMQIGRSHA